jgi:flavin reductase (DIM6/NTAB) family NADH-FMN oxidoreductase RutF
MKTEWLQALGTMTYGVYVLTTVSDDRINGMVASWVSQVSYEPPLIAVAVHPNRFSHRLIEEGGLFTLHILGKDQKKLAARFMGSDPDLKFAGIDWQPGQTGCPVLKACAAYFECRLTTHIQPGNHTVFIGEVVAAQKLADVGPLTTLDYRGQYIGKV